MRDVSVAAIAVAQGTHLPAKRLFAYRDAEFQPKPLGQILQTLAHDAIEVGRRSALDGLCQGGPLAMIQP
ncbi:hypothetical protein CO652_25915 [Rhizobium sp. H4]|nr:hypothetical protein CO652_25915 [Rhizobium sp. H4]